MQTHQHKNFQLVLFQMLTLSKILTQNISKISEMIKTLFKRKKVPQSSHFVLMLKEQTNDNIHYL